MGVPITYNLRNLAERKATTLMTAFGIGLTVAVLVVSIALRQGLVHVFSASGHPLQMLVMRKGVASEGNSTVTAETFQIVRQLSGVAVTKDGEPMASPEALTVINLPSVESPKGMNLSVRGMLPIGVKMRDLAIVSGKMFEAGKRELIVGDGVARRYPNAAVGQELKFGRGLWTVVGTFKAGDSAANSEIWTDLDQLRGDFESSGGSNVVLVRADNTSAFTRLSKTIDDDQRLGSSTTSEKEYYKGLTSAGAPIMGLGFFVAVVMSIGSAFAATNTMYAAVARRGREIGTLRAIGFGRWAILRSFLLESVCLSMIGGVVGILLALPMNNFSTGVGSFVTFSEFSFRFEVLSPWAIGLGLTFAAVIGAVGGFLPAWAASRKDVISAMREP